MRLLYLCSDFGITPSGTKGASVHLREITRALAGAGNEVLLLSPKGGLGDDHPAEHVLAVGSSVGDKIAKRLKHWLQERGFGDSVAKELRSLLYNTWVHQPAMEALAEQPPDAIIERLSLFGHVGIDVSDSLDIPLVLEVNAPLADEAGEYRSLQLTDLASEMQQRVLQKADAVAVVSESLRDRLAGPGVDRDKFYVIPNGADYSLFAEAPPRDLCRQELGLGDEFVVGFVGSLKPWHGVDVLLAAFGLLLKEVPSARLLVVGAGPAEEQLRDAAAELTSDGAVTFTGAVPHESVPRLLKAMDVAVAPFKNAPDFYFSPIKLFEYMASGTCVVASKLGQIAEVLQDGVNGLLVTPDDERDLYRALLEAQRSPDTCRRLGACAQNAVQTRYTWPHAASALTRVIKTVVRERRSRPTDLLARSR